jgi:hypothetical protein
MAGFGFEGNQGALAESSSEARGGRAAVHSRIALAVPFDIFEPELPDRGIRAMSVDISLSAAKCGR